MLFRCSVIRALGVGFGLTLALPALAASPVPSAAPSREAVAAALRALEQAAGTPVQVSRSPVNGLVTFLSVPPGHAVPVSETADTPAARALAFLESHGQAFGLAGTGAVRVERVKKDELGLDHVRVRQLHRGVPVTAGELMVHLSAKGVVAVNGETLNGLERLSVEPSVPAAGAAQRVRDFLARRRDVHDAKLSEPRLEVMNRGLLEGRWQPTRLAWFVEATGPALRRFVWVDARNGAVLLDFSQLPHALNRFIYTSGGTGTLPGTLVRTEGGPATGDTDADRAYDYAGDTYNYYFSQHGRDSYNGAGAPLVSSVHFCPPGFCPFENAFWTGAPESQMVYGDGYASADDVVAHELTHGVTEYEANLFYYMQGGALNESFSDIFGETVDLTNGRGTDTPGVRWRLAEDLPIGAIRDMMTPTVFGDPGKMSDPQFVCEDPGGDGGGVHSNSGVPNHAYALMVDGGTYNGITVAGIGLTKAAKVQYRALTLYLLTGSDFLDDNNALRQSCTDLIGTAGITAADCTEVGKALDAVQMPNPWPCAPAQAAVPAFCPAGLLVNTVFLETFEGGFGGWSTQATQGSNLWFGGGFFATSGTNHLYGDDDGDVVPDDSRVFMNVPVAVPADARLQFNHSYGFDNEPGAAIWYDGGVVEYSIDGGFSWLEALNSFNAGANYGGTLAFSFGNPLAGRFAFVGESWGYTATQLSLTHLAGQNVQFRFRIGTDNGFGDYGWFIDDFRIYTCVPPPPPPAVFIDDVAVREGNSGTTTAAVYVRLTTGYSSTITVDVATQNGTAVAPGDYASGSTTLSFPPGAVAVPFNVTINGDTSPEPNETLFVNLTNASGGASIADAQGEVRIMDDDLSRYYALTPCRVADTRGPAGPSGGPALNANTHRSFPAGGLCGIPADAKAVAINVTVANPSEAGDLRLRAAGTPVVQASTINYRAGRARANSAIVPLGVGGQITVTTDMAPGSTGTVHFLYDVFGYFR